MTYENVEKRYNGKSDYKSKHKKASLKVKILIPCFAVLFGVIVVLEYITYGLRTLYEKLLD